MNKEAIKARQMEERRALNAAHAEKLAELERRGALEATLPDQLPAPDYVHFFGKRGGAPWITYKVKDLAAALVVLDAYAAGIVPYRSSRAGGCRTLQPVAEMSPAYKLAAKDEADWFGPMLRYDVGEGFTSAKLEFWTKTKRGELLKIAIEPQGARDTFGFYATCRMTNEGHIKPGSWRAPEVPACDEVTTWASGSPTSAAWALRWRTLAGFREVIGAIVAKRAEQAEASRVRELERYKAERKPAEIAARCRFVLEVLNRPAVANMVNAPRRGWNLEAVRAVGYSTIAAAVAKVAPEVLRVGLHDFVNTVYFLSKDTDEYDHATHYRNDLRETFAAVAAGREVL